MMDNQQMGPPAGSPPLGQAHGPFGPTAMGPQFGMGQPNPGMMANPMANAYMGQPPGMLNPANTLSADLKDAMRSFRDSLAFSFQTLNLTLSSLNQTVSTVGTKLGRMTPDTNDLSRNQYAQVGTPGVYLGGMSPNMANYLGNNSFGSIFSHYAPANISPLEFYTERARELGLRSSNMMVTAGAGLGEELVNWGATMWAGKKIMGALGLGTSGLLGEMGAWALGAPIGTAATVAASYLTDPIVEYATRHNRDVAMMRRMSPRIGSGFDLSQSQRAVRGLESLALQDTLRSNSLQPRMGLEGFKEMTMMGLQGNMFNGSSADDLIKQVSSASFVVKFLMGVMGNKDVRETMTLVKQLKDMGINVFQAKDMALTLGGDAFKYGRAMGVDAGSLFNTAANMSMAAYGQFGNPAFVGIRSGMQNLAYMQELEKRGLMSAADIAAGGGAQNIGARMMSLEAGMMNSYSLGLPMLYAGWDGDKGFDQAKFKNSFANGNYFSVIQGAISNMYQGNIADLAHLIMNKNNILADAESKDGGKLLEQNRLQMLDAKLRTLPGYNDPSISLDKKESLAAYYIMQIAPSMFQTEIDPATAKAYAKKIVRPSVMRRVESVANMRKQQGAFEYISASRGIGRFWESITEGFEKLGARLHDNVIGAPARNVADWATNKFEALHGNPFIENDMTMPVKFDAYLWAQENDSGQSLRRYSQSAVDDAMNRQDDPDSLVHLFKRAFLSNRNRLEDQIAYNLTARTAALHKRIAGKDRLTKSEFFRRYGKRAGDIRMSDFERAMNTWDYSMDMMGDDFGEMFDNALNLDSAAFSLEFYRNAKKNLSPAFMGMDLRNSKAGDAPKLNAAAAWMRIADIDNPELGVRLRNEAADLMRKYNVDVTGLERMHQADAKTLLGNYINSDVLSSFFDGNTNRLSQNADFFTRYFGEGALSADFLNKLKSKGASSDDISRIAAELMRTIALKGGDSQYTEAMAMHGVRAIEDLAESHYNPINQFMLNNLDGLGPISLRSTNATAALSKMNITPEELHKLMSSTTDKERDAFTNALGEMAVMLDKPGGLHAVQVENLTKGFRNNKEAMALFDKLHTSFSGSQLREFMFRAFDDAEGKWNYRERYNNSPSLTGSLEILKEAAKDTLASSTNYWYQRTLTNRLNSLGIYASPGESVTNTYGKVMDIVGDWKNRNDLTQEQRQMLYEQQRISSMSELEQAALVGMDTTGLTSKNSADQKAARDRLRYLLGGHITEVGASVKDQEKETTNLALSTKKSAIDATVMPTSAGPAVRVIQADSLADFRRDLSNDTTKFATDYSSVKKQLENHLYE